MELTTIAAILQLTFAILGFAFYAMAIVRICLTMRAIKYLHENTDKISHKSCYHILGAVGLDVDAIKMSFETKTVGDWSKYKTFSISVWIVYALLMFGFGLAVYFGLNSWIVAAIVIAFPWIMLQCFAPPKKLWEEPKENT